MTENHCFNNIISDKAQIHTKTYASSRNSYQFPTTTPGTNLLSDRQWVLIKAKNFKVVMDELSNLGIYYSCPAGKTSPGVRTLQGKEALKVV